MVPFGDARIYVTDLSTAQRSNWKVVVDNYLEGYHVPVAHPGLMRLLDYQRYTVEPPSLRRLRRAAAGQAVRQLAERLYQRLVSPMPGLRDDDSRMWRYLAIYPNTLIDLTPITCSLEDESPRRRPGRRAGRVLRRRDCDLRTRIAQRLNI